MTHDHLEDYLAPEVLRYFEIELLNPAYYLDANNIEPPITKASLSELDLARIINDPKLRHDINFEREISFKPNTYGEHLQEKLNRAQMYWEALIVEFALYSHRQRYFTSKTSTASGGRIFAANSADLSILRRAALRLPYTFAAIRDILKTLVPGSEWAAIDERLDVDLLIQELENGVCDIQGLAYWLGQLLLRSCSPSRDPQVKEMVALIQQGADKDDPRLLALGMKAVFGILETMRLVSSLALAPRHQKLTACQDVANHQIRYLRLLMIDDTVHFEQKTFLHRVACGWDLRDARAWLDTRGLAVGSAGSQPWLSNIVQALIDLVCDDRPLQPWPGTLAHDIDRLMGLKWELHLLLYRRACFQACEATVRASGGTVPLLPEVYQRLWTCIEAVLDAEKTSRTPSINNRAPALEIVREACRVCNRTALPDQDLLSFAESHIYTCMDAEYGDSQRHRFGLGKQLTDFMIVEVQHLKRMTPLQMLDYVSQKPQDRGADEEQRRLSSIARRLAHVSVLHWRVWAPILYDQTQHLRGTSASLAPSMDLLSLAEPATERVGFDGQEQHSWLNKTMSVISIEAPLSELESSNDSLTTSTSEHDSLEDNEPLEEPY